MKRLIFLLTMLLCIQQGFAQLMVYSVEKFSDEYNAKVYITDTTGHHQKGRIVVYNKEVKRLIKVDSDRLYHRLNKEGLVKANILESPYGEQSVLIYDDFNFDGEKDFALSNGMHSCYAGPSYDIYLFTNGTFIYSADFSRLSNEYCGMFEWDVEKERIYAMTKSSYSWHQYSEFIVEDNKPFAVKITEYDGWAKPPYSMIVTEQSWNGERMVKKVIGKEIDLSDIGNRGLVPFSFQLENGKWVLFIDDISVEEGRADIRYAFVDAEGKVELEYPNPDESRKFTDFVYSEKEDGNITCSFSNGNAKYTVYDYTTPERELGVKVVVNGKTYNLKGKPETATRSLRVAVGCDNVKEQYICIL